MKKEKTFWSSTRRRLIAKTLANLFLVLAGALATSEVIGSSDWLKLGVSVVVVAAGCGAVIFMPEEEDSKEED